MGAAVGLILGLASLSEQQKAARKQGEQQVLQRRRSIRQLIRERQIKRAEARVAAESAGLQASSGFFGGQTSLSSQAGGALGYGGAMSGLSQEISSAQANAQMLSGLSSLSFQAGKSLSGLGGQP